MLSLYNPRDHTADSGRTFRQKSHCKRVGRIVDVWSGIRKLAETAFEEPTVKAISGMSSLLAANFLHPDFEPYHPNPGSVPLARYPVGAGEHVKQSVRADELPRKLGQPTAPRANFQ
jgi:hypothetical protein